MEYLIDPRGTWSRWPDENLAYRLGYPQPDFDLAGYAARNLGYVWLLIERGMTLMQFRAGMVSGQTVNALKPYLSKATADAPVALVYYASGWMEEVFVDPAALIARFQLVAGMREPRQREKFIMRAHEPERWEGIERGPLRELFGLWRERSGMFDDRVHTFLQESGLAARTMLAVNEPGRGLCITYGGEGYAAYDNFRTRSVIGRSIADQPDREYGRWINQTYTECITNGAPHVTDVDAIIEQPEHDARRRRYRRVILRWHTPDGGLLLSSNSRLDQNISIPLDLSAATAP